MALTSGTRLGSYEIVSALGAGGMGEVYRAHDATLKRDVAIKILPESLAGDADRLARFQREAEVLASINHQHIAAIYGVEQREGIRALVLELVEGETLAERIARGALPLDEALEIARQIAEALAAAHEQGIIHRDLKPANVKVRPDGTVKVLDFGLAKALAPDAASTPDPRSSPTISLQGTQAGLILGTAAYMSPEQATGKAVDKRADVWAFGCVLYEMLTAHRPFESDDVSQTLARVLLQDPDWARLPPALPGAIRALLTGCLVKDPRRRVADISIVLFVLAQHATLSGAGAPIAPVISPPRWRRALMTTGLILTGAIAAGGATWVAMRPDPNPLIRTMLLQPGAGPAVNISGFDRDLAITPDGRRVIYRTGTALAVRPLDGFEHTLIEGVGEGRYPFVSPDGQWVGFFDSGTLKKVAITGGPAVALSPTGGGARGAAWAGDGTIIFADNSESGLLRVSAAGGEPEVLTVPDRSRGEADHVWPELLPDGRGVLFTVTSSGSVDNAQIAALDFRTGTTKVLVRGGSHAQYLQTGHLIYAVSGTIRAAPFDLDTLEVTGSAVPVMQRVVTTGQGAMDLAVAANGTLAYLPGGVRGAERTLVWLDRQGREEVLPVPPRGYFAPRISPDASRIALEARDQENDLWIWHFARQTLTRLTFDPALDQFPVWSPDSRRVLFGSTRLGNFKIFAQAADGTGNPERLTDSPHGQVPYAMTRDGTAVIAREIAPRTGADVLLIPLAKPEQARPLVQTAHVETNPELSPDGRWMAYQSNASGQYEVYVQPFPDVSGGRWQVSTAGGRIPLWSRDGRELFYVAPEGSLMGVRVDPGEGWNASTPEQVLRIDSRIFIPGVTGQRTFDIAPDGRRFLFVRNTAAENAFQNIAIVQNWFEELTRLVPMR